MNMSERTNRELWKLSGKGDRIIRSRAGQELMRRTDTSPERRQQSNQECERRMYQSKRNGFTLS